MNSLLITDSINGKKTVLVGRDDKSIFLLVCKFIHKDMGLEKFIKSYSFNVEETFLALIPLVGTKLLKTTLLKILKGGRYVFEDIEATHVSKEIVFVENLLNTHYNNRRYLDKP